MAISILKYGKIKNMPTFPYRMTVLALQKKNKPKFSIDFIARINPATKKFPEPDWVCLLQNGSSTVTMDKSSSKANEAKVLYLPINFRYIRKRKKGLLDNLPAKDSSEILFVTCAAYHFQKHIFA